MDFRLRKIILTVYIPAFLTSFCMGMLAPTIPAKVDLIGGTAFIIGLTVGAQGLGEAFFSIQTGFLINKFGNKKIMLTGMLGIAIAGLLSGFFQNNLTLYFSLFSLGIFYGFFSLSRHSFMTQIVPSEYRGKAFSRFGGINRIGWFFGPVVGGFTAGSIGVDVPFYFISIVSIITAVIILFSKEPDFGAIENTANIKSRTFKETILENKKSFTVGGSGHFIMQFLRQCRHVLIPIWAFSIGLGVEELGLIQSISAAIDMTLFYPVGLVMDKYGRKWMSVPSIILLSSGFIFLTYANSFTGLMFVGLILGFANGLGSGAMLTLGSDLSPKNQPGSFLGIWRLFGWSGNSAGGPISGAIAQTAGNTASALSVSMIGGIGIIIFSFFLPETLKE
jgi:MFS family permease